MGASMINALAAVELLTGFSAYPRSSHASRPNHACCGRVAHTVFRLDFSAGTSMRASISPVELPAGPFAKGGLRGSNRACLACMQTRVVAPPLWPVWMGGLGLLRQGATRPRASSWASEPRARPRRTRNCPRPRPLGIGAAVHCARRGRLRNRTAGSRNLVHSTRRGRLRT